ncbi:MAG TPA: hypothetical protein VJH23_00295 [archaeon]|nr:hypothetical protein [archaeon]
MTPSPAKKSGILKLRYLHEALKHQDLGLGIRGMSWQRAKEGLASGLTTSKGRDIYVWQAPRPEDLKNPMDTIKKLRATIHTSVNILVGTHPPGKWAGWRTPKGYPVIVIVGNHPQYRGGNNPAVAADYAPREGSERGYRKITGFPQNTYSHIPKKHLLAVVRPTKQELKEIEKDAKSKSLGDPLSFTSFFGENFKRLMVNKTANALVAKYKKELEAAKGQK